jgi:hypothetical protein
MIGNVKLGTPRASPLSLDELAEEPLGHGSCVMFASDVDGGTLAVVAVDVEELVNVIGSPPPWLELVVPAAEELVEEPIVSLGDAQPPIGGKLPLAETLPPPPPLALVVWAAAPPAKARQAVTSNTNGVANRSADIRTEQSKSPLKRSVGRSSKGSTGVLAQRERERATTRRPGEISRLPCLPDLLPRASSPGSVRAALAACCSTSPGLP